MTDRSPLDVWLALKLGESNVEIELQSRAEALHAIDLMVRQATRAIDVFTRDMDARLFDRSAFLDALARLCIQHRQARIRILVQDPKVAVQHGNRLVELSRRFSSAMEIRHVHEDYRYFNEAFLLADEDGVIHRPLADRYEGTANFHDPVRSGRLARFFLEVWERSELHPDLRRLHL